MLILHKNNDLKKIHCHLLEKFCTTLEGRGERVWGVN
jgi:hypothetical protein